MYRENLQFCIYVTCLVVITSKTSKASLCPRLYYAALQALIDPTSRAHIRIMVVYNWQNSRSQLRFSGQVLRCVWTGMKRRANSVILRRYSVITDLRMYKRNDPICISFMIVYASALLPYPPSSLVSRAKWQTTNCKYTTCIRLRWLLPAKCQQNTGHLQDTRDDEIPDT